VARGEADSPESDSIDAARADIWFRGATAEGARRLDAVVSGPAWRALRPDARPYLGATRAYLDAGQPDRARALLRAYDADVTDSAARHSQEPERRLALGHLLVAEGKTAEGIAQIRPARGWAGGRLPGLSAPGARPGVRPREPVRLRDHDARAVRGHT
jgi:hypothetical protein